jgi:hypothetical protein
VANEIVPIPQNLDICGSQPDLTFFLQLLNLNLEILANIVSQQTSTTITLPGVSMVTIPGFDFEIGAEKQALEHGWIGGRYPTTPSPYARLVAHGKINSWTLPGVPPLEFVLSQLNYNVQILIEAHPELSDMINFTPPIFNPCGQQPVMGDGNIGGAIPIETNTITPSYIDSINKMFGHAVQALEDEGEDCAQDLADFADPDWVQDDHGGLGSVNDSITAEDGAFGVIRSVTSAGTTQVDASRTFDDTDFGDTTEGAGCTHLVLDYHLEATITEVGGGVPTAQAGLAINGFVVNLANQVGLVGTSTQDGSLTFDVPTDTPFDVDVQIFVNGNMKGSAFGNFTITVTP